MQVFKLIMETQKGQAEIHVDTLCFRLKYHGRLDAPIQFYLYQRKYKKFAVIAAQ